MTVADTIVRLAAELPDVGHPSFMATCGTFGGFVGMAIGRARRLPWDRTAKLAAEASAVGYGVGCLTWLVVLAIDRL